MGLRQYRPVRLQHHVLTSRHTTNHVQGKKATTLPCKLWLNKSWLLSIESMQWSGIAGANLPRPHAAAGNCR
eukprot:scaffold272049_cov13-Tisochrysis_lutea.AAC.1